MSLRVDPNDTKNWPSPAEIHEDEKLRHHRRQQHASQKAFESLSAKFQKKEEECTQKSLIITRLTDENAKLKAALDRIAPKSDVAVEGICEPTVPQMEKLLEEANELKVCLGKLHDKIIDLHGPAKKSFETMTTTPKEELKAATDGEEGYISKFNSLSEHYRTLTASLQEKLAAIKTAIEKGTRDPITLYQYETISMRNELPLSSLQKTEKSHKETLAQCNETLVKTKAFIGTVEKKFQDTAKRINQVKTQAEGQWSALDAYMQFPGQYVNWPPKAPEPEKKEVAAEQAAE